MENRVGLTLPCHWDQKIVEGILSHGVGIDGIPVTEVYGVLSHGGPVGHGRSRHSVPSVSEENAIEFRELLSKRNLGFTYLLNAPFIFGDDNQRKELDGYLDWILGELKPDALTITSHELMRYVRSRDPEVPIHISTIAGVKNGEEVEKFLDVSPSRVVPHHDVGKRWSDLEGIIGVGEKNGIKVELLSTESCLFECPHREAHYKFLAARAADQPLHTVCNAKKLTHPEEFLMAGGIIRPEDTKIYENMGVNYFKISGRSKPATWLLEVVRAYSNRTYDGNLIRLLGIDPELQAEEWLYIDNKALDGFIDKFPRSHIRGEEVAYCKKWIVRLYKEGKFRVLDGTEYTAEGESLVLKKLGESAEPIITREYGKIRQFSNFI